MRRRTNKRIIKLSGLALLWLMASSTSAQTQTDGQSAQGLHLFETKIRPILVEYCYECHSAATGADEGGLRLDSGAALRVGGDRGAAIVPGKPEESWLLRAITHDVPDLQMPPKRQRLSNAVIADFREWIELGAPDPRPENEQVTAREASVEEEWWSLQPMGYPTAPSVSEHAWPLGNVDAFILSRLETAKLSPSPDAPGAVLLRRLYFDLLGLPPSPAAIVSFEDRVSRAGFDLAWTEEVDRLLASPQFAECWGRHWLDVARFAESSGKEANISFPYAWRYRDYVINCFNVDMPFAQFITEQLAGDLLPSADDAEKARLLIATGFLAIGAKNLDEMNSKQFEADLIDEQIDAVTRAVLASSIACARCHDHKADPYTMQDYYALAGIFASTKTYFGTAVSPANRVGGDPLPLPNRNDLLIFHKSISPEKVQALKAELAELQREEREGKTAVMAAVMKGKEPGETFTLRDALRIFWRSGRIEGELEKVDEQGRALALAMGVLERDSLRDAFFLERGDVGRPAGTVARGLPASIKFSLDSSQSVSDWLIPEDQSGRLQLAQWLTQPEHPLTARVRVNRIWKRLFGKGLVATVDDFGATGERPSHPELLDFLAQRYLQFGGSTKHFVRELVLSRTYRQASDHREAAFVVDPDNRWLWRMPKRRLPAEAVRDAMLSVSGELLFFRPPASLVGRVIGDRPIALIGLDKRLPADLDGILHRSVYLPVIRDRMPDALELFDVANPSFVTGERETTNVPLQALFILNSDFVRQRAEAFAARLQQECHSAELQIQLAFQLCYGRLPTASESRLIQNSLQELSDNLHSYALVNVCQALLGTAEFRVLD